MKRSLFGIATLAMVSMNASAATLITETFTYPDGSLVPNGGWVTHSGTVGDLVVTSGQALVQHGAPSEDVNVPFGSYSTGILTATFDMIVNDDTKIAGGDYEYFAHFSDGGTFNFRARIDVVPATGGGDYRLGIASAASTAEAVVPVDFNYGQTVTVTLSHNLDTGTSSLTVGANTVSGIAGAAGETMTAFALRQSDSSNNEGILVDNLVITYVPEPTSLALVGLGGLLIARRRR